VEFCKVNVPNKVQTSNFLKRFYIHLPAYEYGTDSVPKRRRIKFRQRGITQKKAYNIP